MTTAALSSYRADSATAQQFQRLAGIEFVNVNSYKQTGDTDDTAAFQRAIATGKVVMVPERLSTSGGPYAVSANLPLGGTGQATRVLGIGRPQINFSGGASLNNHGGFETAGANVTLRDLVIDSAGVTAFPFYAVFVQHDRFVAEHVSTQANRTNGFNVLNAMRARIRGGVTTPGGGPGIVLDGAYRCTVEDVDLSGTTANFGCYVTNGAHRNTLKNLRCFNDNSVPASRTLELIGIRYNAFANRVEGCHAEGTGDNGISVTGEKNTIVGCVCIGNWHGGIGVYGSRNALAGNTCGNNDQRFTSDGTSFGNIYVQPAFGGQGRDNAIVGNTIWDDQASPTAEAPVKISTHGYNAWQANTPFSASNRYCFNGLNVYAALALVGTVNSGATPPTHTSGTVSDGVIAWTYLYTGTTNLHARNNIVRDNTSRGHRVTDAVEDISTNSNTIGGSADPFIGIPTLALGGNGLARVLAGTVNPNGNIAGNQGDFYLRRGGSTGITLYTKDTGADGGNTGWNPIMPRYQGATTAVPSGIKAAGFQGLHYYDTTRDIDMVVGSDNGLHDCQMRESYATASRPTKSFDGTTAGLKAVDAGRTILDSGIGKPATWDGAKWHVADWLAHPGFTTADLLQPQFTQAALGAPSTSAILSFIPFVVPQDMQIDQLSIYCSVAQTGAKLLWGVYDTSARRPNNCLTPGLAEVDLSTTGQKTQAIGPVQLYRGNLYWIGVWMKDAATQATVTINTLNAPNPLLPTTAALQAAGSNPRGLGWGTAYPGTPAMPNPAPAASLGVLSSTTLPMPFVRVV